MIVNPLTGLALNVAGQSLLSHNREPMPSHNLTWKGVEGHGKSLAMNVEQRKDALKKYPIFRRDFILKQV